ncbi:fluoride efflux transporter CrcB [Sporolactobacillus inulinus]|uniref:Fluoride-specific ion channel FluC n=1 Tax=Sporolactobacillus inulinus CASD TaxID=1069536 RepID=A0A0U1QRN4_9BACL|nr:camphor resistance protein CrcB [Sporolactobacillus inulinus CASD]GEB77436.1 putative fluoride ion transporter CrcB 2 [Sporolactobacillus inulinus]
MLINYLMVALGAAFGVLARFSLSNWIKRRWSHDFPLPTFIINVSGSLALGLITGLGIGVHASLLLGTGFMGAYTTFSTFTMESVSLNRRKKKRVFYSYLISSYVLGIAAVFLGTSLGAATRSLLGM